ncbi:MAG: ATP-binding protein [Bacillota bacterium]
MQNKNLLKISVILFIVILLSSVFLINNLFNIYQQINKIDNYQEQFTDTNELSTYVELMTSNLQNYILFADPKHLRNYYQNSSLAVKKQTKLYDAADPEKKQDIMDLIELTKSYMSFAEIEVIPAIQSQKYSDTDFKFLHSRNEEISHNIMERLNRLQENNNKEISDYFQKAVLIIDNQIISLFTVLLIALLFFPFVIYSFLKPFIIKCIYMNKVAEHMDSAFIFADNAGVVKYINKSGQDLFGLLPESVLEKNIEDFSGLFPHLQNVIQPLMHSLLRHKESLRNRITLHNDTRPIDLYIDYIPVFILNKPVGVMMIGRIANEQKNKPLLLDTLEKERKRISIEIHDWIARYMSTIIHSLDYNLRLHKSGDLKGEELLQSLLDLRTHCQNAAIEMRGIMNDIHPYLIDKVGLISALESYINTFEKLNKVKVYIFYQDRALRIKKKDEIIIYRIIQEGLSNIVKHAKATEVDINFTSNQDTLKIEIMDNGGTEVDFIAGKGLWGMKERANLIGGDIVYGYCETGFCVTLNVPIIPGGEIDGENQDYVD